MVPPVVAATHPLVASFVVEAQEEEMGEDLQDQIAEEEEQVGPIAASMDVVPSQPLVAAFVGEAQEEEERGEDLQDQIAEDADISITMDSRQPLPRKKTPLKRINEDLMIWSQCTLKKFGHWFVIVIDRLNYNIPGRETTFAARSVTSLDVAKVASRKRKVVSDACDMDDDEVEKTVARNIRKTRSDTVQQQKSIYSFWNRGSISNRYDKKHFVCSVISRSSCAIRSGSAAIDCGRYITYRQINVRGCNKYR